MQPEIVTPTELARELGVSPKRVRDILRQHFGTLQAPETRWHLDDAKVHAVRRHLGQ